MIGYHEAVARLREGASLLAVQRVSLRAAVGRVLAADVVSGSALPPFDNAAMDGIALASGGQVQPAGSEWETAARIGAGDVSPSHDAARAWEIMTGAPLPSRADTVMPVEHIEHIAPTLEVAARVRLLADARPGANIRRLGEDVRAGQTVLESGRLIEAAQLMLLAGLGIDDVAVARRPRVALLVTGREIVAPGEPLPPGGIHDATSPYLAAALIAAGAEPVRRVRVGDDVEAFQAALDAALAEGVDLVLSTGAVSKGYYDFVPHALDARGAQRLFHGVALRPGKPVLGARLPEGPLFVGLPGNPLSTAVGFRFLVEPVLRAWLGMPEEAEFRLPLATSCGKRAGLHAAYHATLRCDADGRLSAHVAEAQASFRLLPFSRSSAWITLPAEEAHAPAGTRVLVHGHGHLHPPSWTLF
ncbi:molybdopterin molybdotransferase MoeA [Pseudoxanthomonas sp. SL93]|uniref:molybdopterin molybdotransferase MoeA n=1 Tax=Pseudoxanthomonas sp. SL93 TaxID=2995142 RepID=UPI00226EF34D|nr:molybdopterin molybdotransferase MoeA [Pseudoxanthomonas sp. SL93]WAC62092.1 molybdopterin molybdotransferase MoeA [Pseudoxanthomonas sp. SL93]